MDQATRTALRASIKAWEYKLYLVERKEYSRIELGPEACPLCHLAEYRTSPEGLH